MVSAVMAGKISSELPCCVMVPSAMTTISIRELMILS
jgi:hypothetical protein